MRLNGVSMDFAHFHWIVVHFSLRWDRFTTAIAMVLFDWVYWFVGLLIIPLINCMQSMMAKEGEEKKSRCNEMNNEGRNPPQQHKNHNRLNIVDLAYIVCKASTINAYWAWDKNKNSVVIDMQSMTGFWGLDDFQSILIRFANKTRAKTKTLHDKGNKLGIIHFK